MSNGRRGRKNPVVEMINAASRVYDLSKKGLLSEADLRGLSLVKRYIEGVAYNVSLLYRPIEEVKEGAQPEPTPIVEGAAAEVQREG
jgi:hypothetical protein